MTHWRFRGFPRSIRLRTTVAATVVVAFSLLGASVALVVLQRQQLIDGITVIAQQQNDIIASEVGEGGADEVDVSTLRDAVGEAALVQLLDASGSVIMASDPNYTNLAITGKTPPIGQALVYTVDSLPQTTAPFVIVVSSVQSSDGLVRIVTAQPLASVQSAAAALIALLSIGLPLVLVVVAATSYALVGRALAPVEAIRKRVAELTVADQDTQILVPDSGDEIARLAETMNALLGRLQAAAAAQHRFVADASHELRTPLATIRTTTELAILHPEVMGREHSAGVVLDETRRLERLVSDLLLLARSDDSGLIMRVEDVDLDDILTSEVSRLRAEGAVEVVVDVVSVRVRGDAQHLLRAVRNLMDNAAQFALTTVEVRLRVEEGAASLEISDDGPGIPEGEREHVLERFVRLDESRERGTGGTGLGLAITRQIALAHGGDVRVIPRRLGRGARLRLNLPLPDVADGITSRMVDGPASPPEHREDNSDEAFH